MAQLIDTYGRTIEYLRLSVTDHCNLGCFYCMPEDGCGQRRANRLNNEEFTRLVRLFAELGVHKVPLTGGEPLLYRDLTELVAAIAAQPGIDDLSLSTNAMLLARNATTLRQAGVTRLNISLDSLDAEIFAHITRGGSLEDVLAGIASAQSAGFAISTTRSSPVGRWSFCWRCCELIALNGAYPWNKIRMRRDQ